MYPGDGQPQSSYQGLGYYQQPEPPRKGKNLPMILSIVAIVVIIGAVVAIVLVNRGGSTPEAQNTPAPTTQVSSPPPSSSAKSDPLKPRNAGWSVIKNEKAQLIYEVPSTWAVVPNGSLSTKEKPDVVMSSPATIGSYECETKKYTRGGLGAGSVPKSDLAKAATDIAKAFGADFYSTGTATVQASEPKQVTHKDVNGKSVKGVQVDAIITTTGNTCLATKGKVSVLVLDPGGDYQFFVVNGDLEGGPATPAPPKEAELQKIVDNARGYSP